MCDRFLERGTFWPSFICEHPQEGPSWIGLRQRAWLYGILFLKWYGWHEEEWRCWWLYVGLTYKSVVTFLPIKESATSKKLIDVWDHSAVNFIVGYFSFYFSVNSLNSFSLCSQYKKYVIYVPPPKVMASVLFHLKLLF